MLTLLAMALLSQPDPGSRLVPVDEDGPAQVSVPALRSDDELPDRGVGIGLRTRYAFVPPALLDAFFETHTNLNTWSLGLEVSVDGPGRSRVIFGLDYTRLKMPAGNFRVGDSAFTNLEGPEDADYTEVDLHELAFEVLFAWEVELAPDFGLAWAIGLGAAWVPGTVTSTEVLPTCTEPVEDCPHWQHVTQQTHRSPWPVYPLLIGQLGLYWTPAPGFQVRADLGFRGTMYTGLVTEARF